MQSFRAHIGGVASSPLVRAFIAFGSAEAATRIVRLMSLLIIARLVTPEIFGAAALALSLFELVRVLTNVGIGQRLVIASDEDLPALCETAYRLFWAVCLTTAAVQLSVAAILAAFFSLHEPAAMLAILSLVYVIMPPGLVQIFLTIRANRMGAVARITSAQNIADSLLTVMLVVVWPTAWAIVLPKLLTAPVWTILARRSSAWAPSGIPLAPASEFWTYGIAILGTEILTAVRLHGDKLVVGALLGQEMLGIYYFAFNAGLGLTQSFVAACNLIVFPHFAKAATEDSLKEYRKAFAIGLAFIGPVCLAQALLAPIYVPIVFGDNWTVAAPYVALLSCAALPLYAGSLVGAKLRTAGLPQHETVMTGCATAAAMIGLTVGAQSGLIGVCIGFASGLAIVFVPIAAASLTSDKFSSSTKFIARG